VFERRIAGARPVLVALNTANSARGVPVPAAFSRVLLSTDRGVDGSAVSGSVDLPPLGAAWIV
jgi:hypothetical protein